MASTLVIRRFADPAIVIAPIHQGIIGTFYRPAAGPPRPGVLVIGGSDGGPGEPGLAMLFASHGFAAMSLSYFGERGLPATLESVPMEYFDRAVAWMCRQPTIDARSIAIYSESRGTEPALFTASRDPRVHAVVARSPSFVLWGGVDARHLPGGAAWTLSGKPLPYIANTLYPDFVATYLWDRLTGISVRQTPLFLEDLAHAEDRGRAEIRVEGIRGPVMLLAGEDDQIWPSAAMSDAIMARLRRSARAYGDEQLKYVHVGHAIPFVYLPTSGRWQDSPFAVGGTPDGMAKAQADAWPKILKFLSDAAERRH
jgi:dienelactone hydrolase